jgi:hypothetical protein
LFPKSHLYQHYHYFHLNQKNLMYQLNLMFPYYPKNRYFHLNLMTLKFLMNQLIPKSPNFH